MHRHVLYPGSFDPVTLGHLDLVERASRLFDQVTVVVAASGKAGLLGLEERVDLFRAAVTGLPGVDVEPFSGLLVEEVRRRGATAVVRGIRTPGDYEHEWTMAGVNALLAADVEYVYLLARPHLAAISSTLVRDVMRHGGALERLVPEPVARALAGRGA
ncbi:MAG: pantetheine-phosphate adenylyltransferase [bacterium]|nr:pantetheine-phosphate adenylyltransferase [bacterium]